MNEEQSKQLERLMGQLEDVQDKAQEQVDEIKEMRKSLESIKRMFDKDQAIKDPGAYDKAIAIFGGNQNNTPQI